MGLQKATLLLLLLLLVLLHAGPGRVHAYPNGPPPAACDTMTPTGHRVPAQTSESPFSVRVVADGKFTAGDYINVTVESTDDQDFMGLFLQARLQSDTDQIVGSFYEDNLPDGLKSMACGGIEMGAVSHARRLGTRRVTVYWQASNVSANVYFQATVVREKTVFWQNVKSAKLEYSTTTSDYTSDTPPAGAAVRVSATSPFLVFFVTLFAVLYA